MNASADRPHVLVLGGGPDAEREVSLKSARAIADALESTGRFGVTFAPIHRVIQAELSAMPGTVIFPYLHGAWGEGGPLQDLLEADGRPFVGSGACASRQAMDKVASKAAALRLGIATPMFHVFDPRDPACPIPYPVILKPVHEGSTVGLFVCTCDLEWRAAREVIAADARRGVHRAYLIEPRVGGGRGRELTVGIIDRRALPIIEITPAEGLYDYEAKYNRDDTRYTLDPSLPAGLADRMKAESLRLFAAMGCRHIARVDFMLDPVSGQAHFLEINTTPGFTDHSLVPKAARHAGQDMPALCAELVGLALRDARSDPNWASTRGGGLAAAAAATP
ncbi:MAG: D-alanine--D-alanine ligase [Phycisphaerae bacterium]|nr:D-alanine--D-alanine ligase [Phycisphaerae bacterium]